MFRVDATPIESWTPEELRVYSKADVIGNGLRYMRAIKGYKGDNESHSVYLFMMRVEELYVIINAPPKEAWTPLGVPCL